MFHATTRAVREGLLVCPDETLAAAARIEGVTLYFNPDRRGVDRAIDRVLDAAPDHARSAVVLELVAERDRQRAAFVALHGREPAPWERVA